MSSEIPKSNFNRKVQEFFDNILVLLILAAVFGAIYVAMLDVFGWDKCEESKLVKSIGACNFLGKCSVEFDDETTGFVQYPLVNKSACLQYSWYKPADDSPPMKLTFFRVLFSEKGMTCKEWINKSTQEGDTCKLESGNKAIYKDGHWVVLPKKNLKTSEIEWADDDQKLKAILEKVREENNVPDMKKSIKKTYTSEELGFDEIEDVADSDNTNGSKHKMSFEEWKKAGKPKK